jgi:hypothetical protein
LSGVVSVMNNVTFLYDSLLVYPFPFYIRNVYSKAFFNL